jgi:hypothetical protein
MKEGDQGTRRAGEAKEKEKRTKDEAPKTNVVLKRKTRRRKPHQETGLSIVSKRASWCRTTVSRCPMYCESIPIPHPF